MKLRHIRLYSYHGLAQGKQNQNSQQNLPIIKIPLGRNSHHQKLKMQGSYHVPFCKNQQDKYKKKQKKTYLKLQLKEKSKIQNDKDKDKICLSSRNTFPKKIGEQKNIISARIFNLCQPISSSQNIINILAKHKITVKMRAKMIDWILQVLSAYQFGDDTFFLAISIMDIYFMKSQTSLMAEDLHLIGVTCLYMASKFQQVFALRLKTVYQQIAHKKISKSKILQKEGQILQCLDFILIQQNSYYHLQEIINSFRSRYQQEYISSLYKHSVYLLKLALFDSNYYYNHQNKMLAEGAILVAMKIFPLFNLELQKNLIKIIPASQIDQVFEMVNQLIEQGINFKNVYPDYKNLEKTSKILVKCKDKLNLTQSAFI